MLETIISQILAFTPYYILKGTVFLISFPFAVDSMFSTTLFTISWFVVDEVFFNDILRPVFYDPIFPEAVTKSIVKTYSKLFSLLGSHENVHTYVSRTMELYYSRSINVDYVREAFSDTTRFININKYPDVLAVFRLIGENMKDDSQTVYSYFSYMVDDSGKRVKGGFGPNNPFQFSNRRGVFKLPDSTVEYKSLYSEIQFKHVCFLGGSVLTLAVGVCLFNPDIIKTAIDVGSNTISHISSKF